MSVESIPTCLEQVKRDIYISMCSYLDSDTGRRYTFFMEVGMIHIAITSETSLAL